MNPTTSAAVNRLRRSASRLNLRAVVVAVVAVGLLAAAALAFWPVTPDRTITAHFTRAVGLYPGSQVRVLGVPVGTVQSVSAAGRAGRGRAEGQGRRQGAGRRAGRDPVAVPGQRPVRPAAAGLHRRGADGRPRRHPGRAHGRPGRARPGHPEPGRPEQGARPARARTPTARCPGCWPPAPTTSAARARRPTRPCTSSRSRSAPLSGSRDDLFTTVQEPADLHQHAGGQRPAGAPAEHRPGLGRRPAERREGRPRRWR